MSALIILYAVAAAILLAEIFIPSHGVLSIVGLGFLIYAIVRTFDYGTGAGTTAIVASVILLPVMAIVAVKVWPDTKIGRLIAPLNPVSGGRDAFGDADSLRSLVGRAGRSVSPLRPVGTCVFDGRRLQCVCESGMIDADQPVRAVGIRGRQLEVAAESATGGSASPALDQ